MITSERSDPKQPGMVALYAAIIGAMDPRALGEKQKAQEQLILFVKTLPGFVGADPVTDGRQCTYLLFETEQEARNARDAIRRKGCPVGNAVAKVFVLESALKAAEEAAKKQKN